MQLVIHSPYGSRLNRAWGLALRKRFCRKFNFELQAAATEDNIVLSLTTAHSFDLAEVQRYLSAANVREVLIQALLDAPMFMTRWRWVAGAALALPRFRGGKKVPPQFVRMQAEDLVSSVFPDQIACAENLVGEREIPDHPLVRQTISDCLSDAMDADGLERLLQRLESGAVQVVARDLTAPSPLALEVLTARPYAYLDDAPLEERRTQAVMNRRWLGPESATDIGRLDAAAIQRVREEAWPEAQNADELHDALVWLGYLTQEEVTAQPPWSGFPGGAGAGEARHAPHLAGGRCVDRRRAAAGIPGGVPGMRRSTRSSRRRRHTRRAPGHRRKHWSKFCAAVSRAWARSRKRRCSHLSARRPSTRPLRSPAWKAKASRCAAASRPAPMPMNGAIAACSRASTPTPSSACAPRSSRSPRAIFCASCSTASASRPPRAWRGPEAIDAIMAQIEGFEAPAAAWESEILPARLDGYEPSWLDDLCLSGRISWARLRPHAARADGQERGASPVRTTPITLLARRHLRLWSAAAAPAEEIRPSAHGQAVVDCIRQHGASFFDEIVEVTRLLRPQVEEALAELVALGIISSDSFGGLRALLVPSDRRKPSSGGRRRRRTVEFGMEDAGRWAPTRQAAPPPDKEMQRDIVEHIARVLLRRYGVVFWRLLEREAAWLPPWRDLLRVYRTLEARGEIRGGRFVAGFSGEQFALPDAIASLRSVRRREPNGELISVSGADPLNLAGILTPGPKLAALTGNRLLYRDGLPVAMLAGGQVRFLDGLAPSEEWQAQKALLRGPAPSAPKSR